MSAWILVLLAVAVIGVWAVVIYNRLVSLRVRSRSAWADIDVQLKRRHDLIPNLVETVEGYAGHERETLRGVVEARNRARQASQEGADPERRAEAEGELSQFLGRLFALSEEYPELRAVESFVDLQDSLEEIEEAIQDARRYYNAVVRDYNTEIEQFPERLVARPLGFQPRTFFEVETAREREAPEVEFDDR